MPRHFSGGRVEDPAPRFVGPDTHARELRENAEREANMAAGLPAKQAGGMNSIESDIVTVKGGPIVYAPPKGLAAPTADPKERYHNTRANLDGVLRNHGLSVSRAGWLNIQAAIAAVGQAAHDLGYEEGFADGQVQARESVGDWYEPRPGGY